MNSRSDNGLVSALIVCLVLPAMAGTWWRYFYEFSAPQAAGLSGTLKTRHLDSDGRKRSYSFYVPREVARPVALVVAFHGANETGEKFREFTGFEFDRLADQHGFIVAYPSGFGGNWNDCRTAATSAARRLDVDDVGFVRSMIGELQSVYGTGGPTYAVGYSDGGQMVYRLAMEAPEMLTASASIAANLPADDNSDCQASRTPVSMAILNGTNDPINPFQGGMVARFGSGNLGTVRSAYESARYFASLVEKAEQPRVERLRDRDGDPSTWVEQSTWSTKCGGQEVTLLEIHGGGHTIPQPVVRLPRVLGPTNGDIDASEEVWNFFTRHHRGVTVPDKALRQVATR